MRQLWSLDKGLCTRTLMCHSTCNALGWAGGGGDLLASVHFDGALRLWDSRAGRQVNELAGLHNGQIICLDVAASGGERGCRGARGGGGGWRLCTVAVAQGRAPRPAGQGLGRIQHQETCPGTKPETCRALGRVLEPLVCGGRCAGLQTLCAWGHAACCIPRTPIALYRTQLYSYPTLTLGQSWRPLRARTAWCGWWI